MGTTQFTFQVSRTQQYGAPASDEKHKAGHDRRRHRSTHSSGTSSTASSTSSSSSRRSRKHVDAFTSSRYMSSAYEQQKRTALFRLDRIAVWAAGVIVVLSMVVCVMAIFVTRYGEAPTTTLRSPIETQDPRHRLAAWDKGEIELVYGWTTPPRRTTTTSAASSSKSNATTTEFVPGTSSVVSSENSTDVDENATMPQDSTMASPRAAFLVEAPQQPVQNNALD